MTYTKEQISAALDLALLCPGVISKEVHDAATLVNRENIATLCVAPIHVAYAARFTNRVSTVIGFPHGNTFPEVKWREARMAISRGAIELDVVINYGRFLQGDSSIVSKELWLIVDTAHQYGVKVKAILETCYHPVPSIRRACELCVAAGVDFVKTSTGFGASGATPTAVTAMLSAVDGKAQVKASGGIKTYADAARYLDLGCTRLGSSCYWELLP